MLTARGSVLLVIAAIGLTAGLIISRPDIALGGLVIVVWIGLNWLGMLWLASRRTLVDDVSRVVNGQVATRLVLTIGQSVEVRTQWRFPGDRAGLVFDVRDELPDWFQLTAPAARYCGPRPPGGQGRLNFEIRPVACGRFELPGLAVEVTDRAGLFRLRRFVPCRQSVTILPWLIRPQTTTPVVKTHNIQAVAGHHAWRRAGISAELLGIRDYRAGDPPRTIAWKPTARTGKFMSREFEMEVPVRSTLICGLADWHFAGRHGEGSIGDRVITAAASIGRLLLADRDPVALVLASDKGASRLPHGAGGRQLVRLLHHLLDATGRFHGGGNLRGKELERAVLESVSRRFPELLDARFNSLPSLQWRWFPTARRTDLSRRRLALALCQLLEFPPGDEFRLACDRRAMADACRHYVRKFGAAGPARPASTRIVTTDQRLELIGHLAQCLVQARSRARDHELFVVISEFGGEESVARRLTDAIRVCRAARHRVLVVDAPAESPGTRPLDATVARMVDQGVLRGDSRLDPAWAHELTRLGVHHAQLDDPALMQIVVRELELIRSGRGRTSFGRV